MYAASTQRPPPIGHLLRHWRQQRRWSQLALACEAEISTRHLSCLETGRARPSREMLLRLADQLEVPLRERNLWLVAAGYAPSFRELALDDPELAPARAAVARVLQGHEPNPALAVDRDWNLVTANTAAQRLLGGLDATLLGPPLNVLRASLHPDGLAPRIVNLGEWRGHLLHRLRRQVAACGDPALAALAAELEALPGASAAPTAHDEPPLAGLIVPLRLRTPLGVLSLFSTTMVFGTAVDITLSELVVESFFAADAATADALAEMARAA